MLYAGADYLTPPYARESSWESLCMFDKGEWHSSSTGLHTSRAAGFHLKSKRPDHPWMHSHLSTMVTFHSIPQTLLQGWKYHRLYQARESHVATLWLPRHRCVLSRDCNVPVKFYLTAAVPSFPCFINCVLQAGPVPCSLDLFLFLCFW